MLLKTFGGHVEPNGQLSSSQLKLDAYSKIVQFCEGLRIVKSQASCKLVGYS